MQRSRFPDHQRSIVIQRRKQEKIGGRIISLYLLPILDAAHEVHLPVQSLLADELLHFLRCIALAHKIHSELLVRNQRQCVNHQPRVLFPNMLTHKEKDKFFRPYSQRLPRLDEVLIRVVGDQVGAVVHHLDIALVAVGADHVDDGLLRNPDEVSFLVEFDYSLYDQIDRHLWQRAGEVVPVFGVEGCNQRNALDLGNALGSQAGGERTMGMNYPETSLENFGQVYGVHFSYSRHIRRAAGNRDGEEIDYAVVKRRTVRALDLGSHHGNGTDHPLQPVGIILHTDGNSVHHRRETIAKQAYCRCL